MSADGTESVDQVYVADLADFGPGDRAVVEAQGIEIAVINIEGNLYAIGNYCPHMGGPCGQGRVRGMYDREVGEEMRCIKENTIISCPWHGWEFNIKTGHHEGYSGARLPIYDVVVEDGGVYVILT